MTIRPLHDRVLVERIEEEERTAGGIIIPDTVKEKPTKGKVVAVGNGNRNDAGNLVALDVQVGDIVLFEKWAAGNEVKLDGRTLLLMKEANIMAVIA